MENTSDRGRGLLFFCKVYNVITRFFSGRKAVGEILNFKLLKFLTNHKSYRKRGKHRECEGGRECQSGCETVSEGISQKVWKLLSRTPHTAAIFGWTKSCMAKPKRPWASEEQSERPGVFIFSIGQSGWLLGRCKKNGLFVTKGVRNPRLHFTPSHCT